ncbi:MAG: FtsB family cell division protein [Thermodesulfobacteriota bacterium]
MYKRIIRSALILVVIIFITFIFSREVSNLNYLHNENEIIIKRIEKLSNQNEDYKERIEAIENDKRYKEKVIREELGMIKKGEKVYRFDN